MGEPVAVNQLKGATRSIAAAPHSVSAEQALIGSVMVANGLYDQLDGLLRPEHFYVPLHAAIFEAMERLINHCGREANPITVNEELKQSPFQKDGELYPHLTGMFESGGFASDVRGLAEVIRNAYVQRQLMALGDGLRVGAEKAYREEDSKGLISEVSDQLYRLTDTGRAGTLRDVRESLKAMLNHAEAAKALGTGLTGVSTGFTDLDRALGGLQRSDLIILGARPSMGKTALVLNIAQHAAQSFAQGEGGVPVGVFSLEMSAEQLVQRMSAATAGIDGQRIGNGTLTDSDFGKLIQAAGTLASLPLYIDEAAGLSIDAMRAKARQMKRKHGIGLLVVDYLQLMSAPGRRNDGNRVQEITEISQGLKQIARDLDIPVLVASQLSRNVESRDNKRPMLADLRDSGSIEQDADVVLFLYREDYYLSRQLGAGGELESANEAERKKVFELKDRLERCRGQTELIISKNRKGPTDTVRLLFEPKTTTFTSAAQF